MTYFANSVVLLYSWLMNEYTILTLKKNLAE